MRTLASLLGLGWLCILIYALLMLIVIHQPTTVAILHHGHHHHVWLSEGLSQRR